MKSTASANPVLTAVAVTYMQDASGFIGKVLFPLFLTGEQSAAYYALDKGNYLNIPLNIQRAPSGAYTRSKMVLSDDTYSCREFGHEEPVDDGERKKYASHFDADSAAAKRVSNILLINHEVRVKNKVKSGAVPSATPGTKWDAANSDPIGDVNAARKAIRVACGLRPNVMTVNEDVFNVLCEHPKITDKIKYTQGGVVTEEMLAKIFRVEKFVVARAAINNANEGQAITPSDIWGDDVVLAHVETAQDLAAPNFGRTFAWTGIVGSEGIMVESYRQDVIASDVHRARQYSDEKLVGAAAGYLLSDVLAA